MNVKIYKDILSSQLIGNKIEVDLCKTVTGYHVEELSHRCVVE